MRVRSVVTEYAPDGSTFAEGCFDHQVGKRVPVWMGSIRVGSARIVRYEIVDEGRAVELEIEMKDMADD